MPTCSSSTSAGRTSSAVFLNMDEQFLALVEDDTADGNDDSYRHFDLVVDDRDAVTQHLKDARIERLSTGGLDFRDPWGNPIQIVAYEDVQFTSPEHVRDAMGLVGMENPGPRSRSSPRRI